MADNPMKGPGNERLCKAHNRSGQPCQRVAAEGKSVCYLHGGAPGSGRPPIHGRYSKAISGHALSNAYRSAVEDPSLLDLLEPIALLEAALQRTVQRLAERDTPDFRERCLSMLEQAQEATARKDLDEARELMGRLKSLLRQGVEEDKALVDMSVQAERLSKRVEAVWGIKLQKRQVLNVQQLGAVISRILQIVSEESTPTVAATIVGRMEREVLQLNMPPGHQEDPST